MRDTVAVPRGEPRMTTWRDGAARLMHRALEGGASRVRRIAEMLIERRHSIRTSDFVYLSDLGLPSENRVWHDPSDWMGVRHVLRRLDVTPQDVFVDYGSGLGRVVLIASTFPFKRVIGVELSPEMTERARSNLQRLGSRKRAASVEFVVGDALAWDVPQDLTIAYFYCPFTGDVFERVVRTLFEAVDAHPRPLRIVYNYPLEHSTLIRTGRVRVLDVVSSRWLSGDTRGPHVTVTYLVLPSDSALRAQYLARFPSRVADTAWLDEYEPGYVLEQPARLGGVVLRRPAVATHAAKSSSTQAQT